MNDELNILMLEDVAEDAELVGYELSRSDLPIRFKHISASDEFFNELKQNPPDVVLSDHGAPDFDGFTMLSLVRDRYPEVPFIFVTGSLNEAMVVKSFARGANDCVPKHRLADLVPAIKRALTRVEERKKLKASGGYRERLCTDWPILREAALLPQKMPLLCPACQKTKTGHGLWQECEPDKQPRPGERITHVLCPVCTQKYCHLGGR